MSQSENRVIRIVAALIFVGVTLTPAHASSERVAMIGFVARQTDSIAQGPRDAVRMAVEEANQQHGKSRDPIRFVLSVQDDQANANLAIYIANFFAKSHVSGVIGHWYSATTLPAAEIYEAAHIPQINFTSTSSEFTRRGYLTAFRVIGGTDDLARSLAEAAIDSLHGLRIVIIGNDSSYSKALTDVITSEVLRRSQTLPSRIIVSSQTSDFNAALTYAVEKQTDLIIFSAYVTQMEIFLNTVKRLGIKSKILFNDGASNLALPDEDNSNIYAIEPGIRKEKCPRWKTFNQKFQQHYGYTPNTYARNAYNAAAMLIGAIRLTDSTDAEKVAAFLHHMHYKGIAGEIAFAPGGALLNPAYTLYHAELTSWQPVQIFSTNKMAASGCPKQ